MSELPFSHVGKSYPSFGIIHVKSSLQGSQAELSMFQNMLQLNPAEGKDGTALPLQTFKKAELAGKRSQ